MEPQKRQTKETDKSNNKLNCRRRMWCSNYAWIPRKQIWGGSDDENHYIHCYQQPQITNHITPTGISAKHRMVAMYNPLHDQELAKSWSPVDLELSVAPNQLHPWERIRTAECGNVEAETPQILHQKWSFSSLKHLNFRGIWSKVTNIWRWFSSFALTKLMAGMCILRFFPRITMPSQG